MPPRPYRSETRQQRYRELRERLARAAAELHAERGAVATGYADIAAKAGVSLPTVYNHFPTHDALLAACTSHVIGQAPHPDTAVLAAAPTLRALAEGWVDAMDRLNAFMAPWLGWREDRVIPFLAQLAARRRAEQCERIAALLAPHLAAPPSPHVVAAWETITAFDTWHRLVREHSLSRNAAKALQTDMLLAATGPRPAGVAPAGPRSEP